MIVTLCGAYKNAGDHLIGARARALLRAFVDPEIITIDRKSIKPEHYDVFNRARAVLLCGGPAYQKGIYPKIYPIERSRISPPIVPYGLGWKGAADKSPDTFKFEPTAEEFVKDIHSRIQMSSARDPLTVQVLNDVGVDNVLMTGCPAWYDLSTFEKAYSYVGDVKNLVLSMPAAMQPGTFELMTWLTKRFPKARRTISFHHGLLPSSTPKGRKASKDFLKFSAASMLRGWRVASLTGSLPKLEELYSNADFHIGYRVHAHLYCLSQRIPSVLINEDSRGVGQAMALGAPNLTVDGGKIEPIQKVVETHFETRGADIAHSVEIMRETFPTMRRFLAQL